MPGKRVTVEGPFAGITGRVKAAGHGDELKPINQPKDLCFPRPVNSLSSGRARHCDGRTNLSENRWRLWTKNGQVFTDFMHTHTHLYHNHCLTNLTGTNVLWPYQKRCVVVVVGGPEFSQRIQAVVGWRWHSWGQEVNESFYNKRISLRSIFLPTFLAVLVSVRELVCWFKARHTIVRGVWVVYDEVRHHSFILHFITHT